MDALDPTVYRLSQIVVGLLFLIFVPLRVRGRRNVPPRGPLLLVCNHLSYLEPPLLGVAMPRRIRLLAINDLFEVAWLAPFVRRFGVLPIRRGGTVDLEGIRAAVHQLQQGEVVGIFPEGTRSVAPGLLRANPGVSLLAARTRAPILPVAVTGTERLDSIAHFLLARLRGVGVRVVIGEPFHPRLGPGKVDHQALADQVMLEVARLLPPAYRGVYARDVEEAGEAGSMLKVEG